MRLNLGCGTNKIRDCVNVDCNEEFHPDLLFNFTEPFPLEDNCAEEIYLFHTIEHIERKYHPTLFSEIHRVLKSDGIFYISYPEFPKILQNWLDNKHGKRDFWEATIYGRQASRADFHVTAIHTPDFIENLKIWGISTIQTISEPYEDYNTVLKCEKGERMRTYEEVLYNEVFC